MNHIVRALGGVGVTAAPGEVYVALERAIVDAFGWPAIGIHEMGGSANEVGETGRPAFSPISGIPLLSEA